MRRVFGWMIGLWILLAVPGMNVEAAAQQKCVHADGEAVVINNDQPSARLEAIARAKWAAIEKTVGIDVKASSFVSNFTLVEDVMKTKVGGSVKSFKVLGQNRQGETLTVTINACIEPAKAQDAISSELALNNGIALFIPARKPSASGGDQFEETNILSEKLIGKLTDQNFKVIDAAPSVPSDAVAIERMARSGSTMAVRSMLYKYLSNVVIVGKIDYTISTKKGEDIGYGLSMPFNNVTVRLTYRMLAKNNRTGNMEVLTADAVSGRGLANNVEDAAARGMEDLVEKLSPKVLDTAFKFIRGNVRKVRVKVNGVKDLDTNIEVKGALQNTVWVTDVEENEMGEFTVSYPENSLYLANSLRQKGDFTLVNFTPYSLTFNYHR
ncbi:MAG: hypothetical protein HPY65_03790 [Syntrophaceae bacterium]|nr:hypothetical protein [Syntrophaceae bacterium]